MKTASQINGPQIGECRLSPGSASRWRAPLALVMAAVKKRRAAARTAEAGSRAGECDGLGKAEQMRALLREARSLRRLGTLSADDFERNECVIEAKRMEAAATALLLAHFEEVLR